MVGVETIYIDRNGLFHTYTIGDLNFALVGEVVGDNIFSNESRIVSATSIYLCCIFATKTPTAYTTNSAIGVNNDFSTDTTTISETAPNSKLTARVSNYIYLFS